MRVFQQYILHVYYIMILYNGHERKVQLYALNTIHKHTQGAAQQSIHLFTQRLKNFKYNFTRHLQYHIQAKLQNFIQLSPTSTK